MTANREAILDLVLSHEANIRELSEQLTKILKEASLISTKISGINNSSAFTQHLAKKIQEAMQLSPLNTHEFAQKAKINRKTLYEILRGKREISFYHVYKIAQSADLDIDFFIEDLNLKI